MTRRMTPGVPPADPPPPPPASPQPPIALTSDPPSMCLSVSEILAHAQLRPVLRVQASGFLIMHTEAPRLASIFGTQQRYMMAQVFLSLAFQSVDGSVLLTTFLDVVVRQDIASRNTADAFVKEMLRYDVIGYGPRRTDRRYRPLILAQGPHDGIAQWLRVHLASLDSLDEGRRIATYAADPALLGQTQPRIVAALMQANFCAPATGTFSLFTWLNEGGLVMDRLMAALPDFPPDATQVPTPFTGYGDLQQALRISRSHLVRNMLQAERMGSLGWTGKRGQSVLWVSPDFVAEYDGYQAGKLAVIDACFHAACADRPATA